MKKKDILVIIFLFIFWIFVFPIIFTRIFGFQATTVENTQKIVGNELYAFIGSLGFYFILKNFIKQRKSKKEWIIMISSAIAIFIVIMTVYFLFFY
jgi:hypothetical protein